MWSSSCRVCASAPSTIATTLSSLWNAIGIVGTLTGNSVEGACRSGARASSTRHSCGSVAVGKEHHPVSEVRGAVAGLLHRPLRIGEGEHEAGGEVPVHLP